MKEYHISEPRINDRIRVPEVRLVGPNGEQVGIVRVEDALRLAQEADLDLVEVAPQARPPVCKLMDFGKFKYESAIKDREARKNQAHTVLKEIRLRLKIDPHDYGTKKGHVERFLNAGDKVKVMIMFRGREQSRPEMGYRLLQRMAADVAELGYVESSPKQDGRNMIMVIGPHKKKAEAKAEHKASRPPRRQEEEITLDQSADVEETESEQPVPVPVAATPAPAAPVSGRGADLREAGDAAALGAVREQFIHFVLLAAAVVQPAAIDQPAAVVVRSRGFTSGTGRSLVDPVVLGSAFFGSVVGTGEPSGSCVLTGVVVRTLVRVADLRPRPAGRLQRPDPPRSGPRPPPARGQPRVRRSRPGPTARPMPGPAPKPGPAPRPGPSPTPGPAPSPKPKDEAAKVAESKSEQAAADA